MSLKKIRNYFESQNLRGFSIEQDAKNGVIQVQLPSKADPQKDLIPLFQKFETDKASLGVQDYSLSLSTLEQVFLNLSSMDEESEGDDGIISKEYVPRLIKDEVGFYPQFNALFWKNFSFQYKSFTTCCCTVIFPAIVMFAMIALNVILFEPQRFENLCGSLSPSQCISTGPDLTCLAKQFQYRPIITPDTITVGIIDRTSALTGSFTRSLSVNPNCLLGTCFVGLEKVGRDIVVSYEPGQVELDKLGYVNNTNDETLFNWHADLLYLIDVSNQTCVGQYASAFGGCPRSPADVRAACLADRILLSQAKSYVDAQLSNGGVTAPGACNRDSNGDPFVPEEAYLNRIYNLNQQKFTCEGNLLNARILPHFATYDLVSMINSTQVTSSKGFMESWSMKTLLNLELKTFNEIIWNRVKINNTLISSWANSIGVSETEFIPTLEQICEAKMVLENETVVFPFKDSLLQLLGGSSSLYNKFCLVFTNLDKVRGTSTLKFVTRQELNLHIYDNWFGQEVSTQFMNSTATLYLGTGSGRYRIRQYHTLFSGIHVKELSDDTFKYVIYHNRTANKNDKSTNWIELYKTVNSAFVRSKMNRDVEFRTQEMPTKFICNRDAWLNNRNVELNCDSLPAALKLSVIDFVALNLFPFLFFTFSFLVVNQIVYEKEQKLRVIMKMNGGLKSSVYWIVSFGFFFVQFLLMSLFIFALGEAAKLRFTSLHAPLVYWAFAVSWGALLVAFSFLISIFFASSQTSTAGVFLFVLVINLVGSQLIANFIQDPSSTEQTYAPLMWLPPFVMIRYLTWMGLSGQANEPIESLADFADGDLLNCIKYFWAEFFVCVFLVWYVDNIYVAGFGTRKPLLFCLNPKYWGNRKVAEDKDLKEYENDPTIDLKTTHEKDVVDEYERVVDLNSPDILVRVVRLNKKFENGFVAVKSLSLGINENECFGLLGHNGAGKSTAISILVGLFEPTNGTAIVDGFSIRTDMDSVQTRMGVCPQHDICWGSLSVRDHLLFYARLKGVPHSDINLAVDQALYDVNLKKFEHRPSSKLSGGMRRRLSTAMSLVASPRVVYLDEPSTGLDPASKRALWKVIEKAKGNKSIVLTTHSLEEAEVLCDRIGIMALGELQCIGTAAQLKKRFGSGYTLFLATKGIEHEQIFNFVYKLFGQENAKLLAAPVGGTFKFEVKREVVVLSQVFSEIESRKEELSILDYGISETSLEEVFLKLADLAHVDENLSKKSIPTKSIRFFCCKRNSSSKEDKVADNDLVVQLKT